MSLKCCVIQPNGGCFEDRYAEAIKPILDSCGFISVRLEQNTSSIVGTIIEAKEKDVDNSDLCIFEITSDDSFVWYLLGYASAIKKELILICSDERKSPFPFSVNNRKLLTYSANSLRSIAVLKNRLTAMLSDCSVAETEPPLSNFDIYVLRHINNQHNTPNEVVPREKISLPEGDATASLRKLTTRQYLRFYYSVDSNGRHSGYYQCTEKALPFIYPNSGSDNQCTAAL